MELAVSAAGLAAEGAELVVDSTLEGADAAVSLELDGAELGVGVLVLASAVELAPGAARLEFVRAAFRDSVFAALVSSAAGFDAGAALRLGAGAASATVTGLSRAASEFATLAGVASLDAELVGSVAFAGCTVACGWATTASLRE